MVEISQRKDWDEMGQSQDTPHDLPHDTPDSTTAKITAKPDRAQPIQPGATRAPVSQGAPGRVAAVHRETRMGLAVAGSFVIAAVIAAVLTAMRGDGSSWWIPLHLFVVGGLLSAVSAVAQMLAVTWSSSPAPSPAAAGTQRWCLAGGAVLLVIGRGADITWMFVLGGVAVIAAMLALAATLWWIRTRAVTKRYGPAIEAYVAAIILGTAGMSIGITIGSGLAATQFATLRTTHLVLNLFGFVGLVIAGTLPYFAATQVRAKMSRRATPTGLRTMFGGLAGAALIAALGVLIRKPVVEAVGIAIYSLGLIWLATVLPIYRRARFRWAGPRAIQLVAGLSWWAAMAMLLAAAHLRGSADQRILYALVVGGFAQILVASFNYLGPVVRGGGHKLLSEGFALTRSWFGLVVGNLAAVAVLAGWGAVAAASIMGWLLDVAARGVGLVVGAKRRITATAAQMAP